MRIIYVHILGLIAAFSACGPDPLPVSDVPIPEQTVVIGSQILPDQFLTVAITKNFNALEGGRQDDYEQLFLSLLINNLELSVEVMDKVYDLNNVAPGLYVGAGVPQHPGSLYTLSFENPFNGNPVTASAELQPFVGFDSLGIFIEETEFDTLVNVGLKLQDPPGPNWYMSNVQLINEDFDYNVRPFTELFTDEGQDGKLLKYDYRVFFRDYEEGDTVLVSLANISRDYFEFLELWGTRRPFVGNLGEPINYPTNVENGLGYFHMHIQDVRFFFPGFDKDTN